MHLNSFADNKNQENKRAGRNAHIPERKQSKGQHTPQDQILLLQRIVGNRGVQRLFTTGVIQAKLKIGQQNDKYEQEANYVADQVMSMPDPPLQSTCTSDGKSAKCQPKQLSLGRESSQAILVKSDIAGKEVAPPIVNKALEAAGQPLEASTRTFFEPRFGFDFRQVRLHKDGKAAESANALNAKAYTYRNNVIFGAGQYAPGEKSGLQLLAHELAHVVQQSAAGRGGGPLHFPTPVRQPYIQRTLGDGHDLTSSRFSRLLDLEAAYDDELLIRKKNSGPGVHSGRAVQAIQHALYDLGYRLPAFGADGEFGVETEAAVWSYQRDNPRLVPDGVVGPLTMAELDARFSGTPALPPAAARAARWDADSPVYNCVRSILCPWSPHTVDVLRERITLKSYDAIYFRDEEWNGTNWEPTERSRSNRSWGGYNTGTEIGVINTSCEKMAQILYHEVLHAEQPTTHRTTRQRESYAYRIGEEFSIAMGLGGRPFIRSTDPQGREYADPTKVGARVAATYPSVPAGGGGEEIIGKAARHGYVRVRHSNGRIRTRPAVSGEKVPGPMEPVNEVTHPTTGWTCP